MNYRAFVASTSDLKEHRKYVIEQLLACGLGVEAMEDWGAASSLPMQFSTERVRSCHLLILLVAFTRGNLVGPRRSGITQEEYTAAVDSGIDILPFMMKEDTGWTPDDRQTDQKVEEWRSELLRDHGIGFFDAKPESVPVAPAVSRWLAVRLRSTVQSNRVIGGEKFGIEFKELTCWPTSEELKLGTTDRYARLRIEFAHPFLLKPSVFLSPVALDLDTKVKENISCFRYHIWCENITTRGFEIVIKTWDRNIIRYFEIDWSAHGPV